MTMYENIDTQLQDAEREAKKAKDRTETFEALRKYTGPDRIVPIADVLAELKEIRSAPVTFKSSFRALDEKLMGFRPGQLIVISGPTGHGKTTLTKTLMKSFVDDNHQCVYFSYEIDPLEFVEFYPGTPVFYVPKEIASGRLDWIEKRTVEAIAKYQTEVVFIDHLHFLVDLDALAIARNQSILIGILLRKLKLIALQNGVIIFLVAHMRKKDLEEENPTIDDLRDSSFVGQEADAVLLIWRKAKKRTRQQKRDGEPIEWTNESRLALVKNRRTGALGEFDIVFNHNLNQFTEYAYADSAGTQSESEGSVFPLSALD